VLIVVTHAHRQLSAKCGSSAPRSHCHKAASALFDVRIGILLGSLLSAMAGYLVLWLTLQKGGVREAND